MTHTTTVNRLEAEARKRLAAAEATIDEAREKAEELAAKKVKTPIGKFKLFVIVAAALAAVVVLGSLAYSVG